MKASSVAIVVLALFAGACDKNESGDSSSGMGGGSLVDAGSDADSALPDGATSDDSTVPSGEEALLERLTSVLSPLTQPPFGTAASATAVRGNLNVSVALGTLWDGGPAANDDTRFNVASVSKLLTAARVVSLAHEGALGLEDPLSQHLPGVTLIGVQGDELQDVVTIRQVLMHRSGLPHVPPDLVDQVAGGWSSPNLLQEITASWEIQLVGNPGDYQYSNLGYALIGAIIEKKEGSTFADCMASYLGTIGMPQSTFWPGSLDGNAAHGRVVQQGSVTFHPPAWYGSRYALPFMGLWTTTTDLAGFGSLLMGSKDADSPLYEMTFGSGHGLGPIHSVRMGAPSLEHDGSGPGFYAALVVVPDHQIVLAIATNGGNESAAEAATFGGVVSAAVQAVPDP
jgi:D-alanyl-D-alanine carboxypeptidase